MVCKCDEKGIWTSEQTWIYFMSEKTTLKLGENVGTQSNWWVSPRHYSNFQNSSWFLHLSIHSGIYAFPVTDKLLRQKYLDNTCFMISSAHELKKCNPLNCHQCHKSTTVNKVQIAYFKVLWVCKERWFLGQVVSEFGNPNSLSPNLEIIDKTEIPTNAENW